MHDGRNVLPRPPAGKCHVRLVNHDLQVVAVLLDATPEPEAEGKIQAAKAEAVRNPLQQQSARRREAVEFTADEAKIARREPA
jgi:hypothetical protein